MEKNNLSEIIRQIKDYLDERDNVRDKALKLSRDIIRTSGWAITSLLSGDTENAEWHLTQLRDITARFIGLLEPYPELLNSGFANNALSEYVEAIVLQNILTTGTIPGPGELGVNPVPYLQGLADVVGELRRMILENLRKNRIEDNWRLLEYMETIYLHLSTLDYPDALLPGIRHKTDTARRLVDETKAFLVDIQSRKELEKLLKKKNITEQQ